MWHCCTPAASNSIATSSGSPCLVAAAFDGCQAAAAGLRRAAILRGSDGATPSVAAAVGGWSRPRRSGTRPAEIAAAMIDMRPAGAPCDASATGCRILGMEAAGVPDATSPARAGGVEVEADALVGFWRRKAAAAASGFEFSEPALLFVTRYAGAATRAEIVVRCWREFPTLFAWPS